MQSTVKQRLTEFLKFKQINQSEFTAKLGMSKAWFTNLKNGLNSETMSKLRELYPELNVNYILYGQGDMIIRGSGGDKTKPYFNELPCTCGMVMQYRDIPSVESIGTISVPFDNGAEFFFPATGMSMLPTIKEGMVVGVRHVDRYETTSADRMYLLITKDGERMIKRIVEYDKEKETLTLKSDNPDFPCSKLPTALVQDVYKVVVCFEVKTL